jgi:hypothetical protein
MNILFFLLYFGCDVLTIRSYKKCLDNLQEQLDKITLEGSEAKIEFDTVGIPFLSDFFTVLYRNRPIVLKNTAPFVKNAIWRES